MPNLKLDWIQSIFFGIKRRVAAACRSFRSTEMWLWPILEVLFVALFSLAPLFVTAATKALRSKGDINWIGEFNSLLSGGQLMYYALGFVATSTWLLLIEIRRPRIAIPFLAIVIFFVVIGVSVTIGVDPTAEGFNAEAFQTASYWVFFGGLATYLTTNILKAWQPSMSVEDRNRSDAKSFIDTLKSELPQ